MALFAKLGPDYIVISVEVIDDNELRDGDQNLQESFGINFLVETTKHDNWKQTYKKGVQRKNYATIGGTYDSSRDAFIPVKPFNSWILDEATCTWTAPIAYPDDEKFYVWDEESTSWVETDPPHEWSR